MTSLAAPLLSFRARGRFRCGFRPGFGPGNFFAG